MKRTLSLVLALLWLAISTALLILPGSAFPRKTIFDIIPLFDKWVHVGMFAVLSFLWCMVSYRRLAGYSTSVVDTRPFKLTAIACLAYGIIMEIVQHFFIAYRSFDVWDIIADAAGVAIGVWLFTGRYIKK